jgi:hypothetical protein
VHACRRTNARMVRRDCPVIAKAKWRITFWRSRRPEARRRRAQGCHRLSLRVLISSLRCKQRAALRSVNALLSAVDPAGGQAPLLIFNQCSCPVS